MPANTYGRQVTEALTNKSGGAVAAGDVVIIDTTNNDAFTTSTAGAFTGMVGVAQEAIAINAVGRVLTSGYAALVNTSASVTRGNFGKTHTVAKQAVDAGASRVVGVFCQFLTGGVTPDAHVFGITDASTGAGGAPSTAKYITSASDGTLSAEIAIPGLAGSPDILPGSPSSFDDEFDTTSTLSTVLGALDTNNTTDFTSNLHLKKTTSGTRIDGVFKTAPSTPFTVTCKVSDAIWETPTDAQYPWLGLLLTEASPGKCFTFGILNPTAGGPQADWSQWTNNTTRGTFADVNLYGPVATAKIQAALLPFQYLRMVVTSSSSVAMYVSHAGYIWKQMFTGVNTGLTIANVGLFVTGYAAITMEAAFDWIRFS